MRKLLLTIIVPEDYEDVHPDLCIEDMFKGELPTDFIIESVEEVNG